MENYFKNINNMEATINYQTTIFREKIKEMEDRNLLLAYSNKADYNSLFNQLAEEELALRGYVPSEVEENNIDFLIIRKKEIDELVEIYTNDSDYVKSWKELAENELKRRGFDISSLYGIKSRNKQFLKEGMQGRYIVLGYIFSFLGGLVGLAFAINYAFTSQTAVNGEKFPKYNRSTRSHGKAMLILAIGSIIMQLIMRLS